jgi:hypothetical protein
MAEEIKPIKSLDELQHEDVVVFSANKDLFVVQAINDVPGHEREAVFTRLYKRHELQHKVYWSVRVLESEVGTLQKICKLDKNDYKGLVYLVPNVLA